MVDLGFVVQGQRVIARAPVVADARVGIDDQGIDTQVRQPRRRPKPGLPAADDDHGRVTVCVGRRLVTQILPVFAAPFPRERIATGFTQPYMLGVIF